MIPACDFIVARILEEINDEEHDFTNPSYFVNNIEIFFI